MILVMEHGDIEQRLRVIEERNARVEKDKAWEVSLTRRVSISLLTYLVALVGFVSIGSSRPFLDATIPVIGFILSVQSLPILKRWWARKW